MESAAISEISGHRLRPAVDLLMRIPDFPVRSVADLGAGAGNVTKLIKERWPEAGVVGVEGSVEMVAAGKTAAPEVEWLHQDLGSWHPAHKYDLIYSNAALHWLPDHGRLFPSLLEKVEPGGILAVQMPRNFGAPSHLLIAETALNGAWRSQLQHLVRHHRSRNLHFITACWRRSPQTSISGRRSTCKFWKARTRSKNGPRAPG